MKFLAIFAAVISVVAGQWAQYELGSSYGSAPSYKAPSYSAPTYSAPSYTAKPSYAPAYAGPATSYTYPSPAPPG